MVHTCREFDSHGKLRHFEPSWLPQRPCRWGIRKSVRPPPTESVSPQVCHTEASIHAETQKYYI